MGKKSKYGQISYENEFCIWLQNKYDLKKNVAMDYIYRARKLQFLIDFPLDKISIEKISDIEKTISQYIANEKKQLSRSAKYALKNNMLVAFRRYEDFLKQLDNDQTHTS